MFNTSAAGIDSSMEALGDGDAQDIQGGEDIDLDNLEDDVDLDDEDVEEEVLLDDEEFERRLQEEMNDGGMPDELSEYIHSLEAQTRHLEEELEDCDELMGHSGSALKDNAVVVYDEYQEMEKEAAAQGLTVEEFKRKLLQLAEEDDFNEEEMDKEFEEFTLLQDELAQIRAEASSVIASRPLDSYVPLEPESPTEVLALEGPSADVKDGDHQENSVNHVGDVGNSVSKNEALDELAVVKAADGVLVSANILSDMRAYIHEQLRTTDEWYTVRKQRLKQSLDSYKQAEDRWTEREEEKKREFLKILEEEERSVIERKEEWDRRIEREIQERNIQVVMELQGQQAEIARVTQALDEERRQFEIFRKEVDEQQFKKRNSAATDIQRIFRGFRTRKAMAASIAELNEMRELRKKERHDVRLMELEYEIKYREEQAQKEKEEQKRKEDEEKRKKEEEEKQEELERQKKEEEERLKEEQKKEEERRKEEEKQEEERKKRELEEQKKEEEKRRKEEEKKKKEEEKRLKEEEKKQKEEEKKRLKEEEKKKKEEEKLRKEEEKKQKEEEKKRKAEEEKQRKEAEKKAKEQGETNKTKSEVCVISPPQMSDGTQANSEVKDETAVTSGTKNESDMSSYASMLKDDEQKGKNITTSQSSSQVNEKDSSVEKRESLGEVTPRSTNSPVPSMKFTPRPPSQPPPPQQQQQLQSSHTPPPPSQPKAPTTTTETPRTEPSRAVPSNKTDTTEKTAPLDSNTASVAAGVKGSMMDFPVASPRKMTPPPPKPDPVEVMRLRWMGNCLSWSKVSNEPWKLKPTSQKPHKRPGSAKKLPPIDKDVILSAAHAESLREVSSVKLTELPGCSLSTLSQCWSLHYLTVTHSGLTSLDGISQCRHLHYIDAQHNQIEYIDLKDLGNLQVLNLSHNKLSVIHGLDGCINLRWLNLSHNRINRLGVGLGMLRRLHSLDLSNNQLVGSDGLSDLVTLQQLDVSHNYLQALFGLDKLCLLMELDVSANNLQEVPVLKNQVLLRTLNLQENSLSSVAPLLSYWLPLLTTLNCGQNMLDSLQGLQYLILLSHLEVTNNQITELDVVTSELSATSRLAHLALEGNPVVDVNFEDYRKRIQKACPSLTEIDGTTLPALSPKVEQPTYGNQEFLAMCQGQVRVQDELWEAFKKQLRLLQSKNNVPSETMCSTIFSFCDTSFKMAAEHRASHEYGDIGTTSSISQFITPKDTASTPRGAQITSSLNKKAKFEAVLASNGASSNFDTPRSSLRESQDPVVSSVKRNSQAKIEGHVLPQYKSGAGSISNKENWMKNQKKTQPQKSRALIDSVDSSDSSDDGVDVTDFPVNDVKVNSQNSAKIIAPAPVASYMNEKDKFEMALNGGGGGMSKSQNEDDSQTPRHTSHTTTGHQPAQPLSHRPPANMPGMGLGSQGHHQKDLFERALQAERQPEVSAKDKFNAALMGDMKTYDSKVKGGGTVTADVVGAHLTGHGDQPDDLDLAAYGLDDFDLDGLDMDIDKFLDMGELDEFLEKGWRPEEMPQIPQSSYPVLGKINPGDMSSNHINMSNSQSVGGYGTGPAHNLTTPPPPPTHAWRDAPVLDLKGKPPRPSPLPLPSPSPSSVASVAETLGGGSSQRQKKDELSQEWGFKDERTAEMMMARARKMKYNAERKKKLSKLDPQQRYQLFRKLEESGKIRHVRPPPAKVLPRKEYFQAREEEAQRQEFERQTENHAKVHRTFEWLHTQVGDYNVSSSRINPGPALYTNSNVEGPRHNEDYNVRRTSPQSDHLDSVSLAGSKKLNQGRRFSTGESYTGHTPTLPPIQVGSAPSTHKGERISWRDEPVEQSGGWGGGKKRKSGARK